MKYTLKEIKLNKDIKSYIKVYDSYNNDIIGRYDSLKAATKDVNAYIDDCEGDCMLKAIEFTWSDVKQEFEATKIYSRVYSKWYRNV